MVIDGMASLPIWVERTTKVMVYAEKQAVFAGNCGGFHVESEPSRGRPGCEAAGCSQFRQFAAISNRTTEQHERSTVGKRGFGIEVTHLFAVRNQGVGKGIAGDFDSP